MHRVETGPEREVQELQRRVGRAVAALLVDQIDIGAEGLDIRLRVDGLRGLAREMKAGDMGAAA